MPRFGVREETYRRLEQQAEKERLTVSELVERLVIRHSNHGSKSMLLERLPAWNV